MRVLTNEDLKITYDNLNSWFFSNRLPKNLPIRFGKPHGKSHASTWFEKDSHAPAKVVLRNFKDGRFNAMLLIHEMIHIKFHTTMRYQKRFGCRPPARGCWSKAPWAKEVRRLARLGLFDWLV